MDLPAARGRVADVESSHIDGGQQQAQTQTDARMWTVYSKVSAVAPSHASVGEESAGEPYVGSSAEQDILAAGHYRKAVFKRADQLAFAKEGGA